MDESPLIRQSKPSVRTDNDSIGVLRFGESSGELSVKSRSYLIALETKSVFAISTFSIATPLTSLVRTANFFKSKETEPLILKLV